MTVAELLGLPDCSELALLDAVRQGLPASAVDAVVQAGLLTREEAASLLALPAEPGQPLTVAASDALVSIARVLLLARESFGNAGKVRGWLRAPNRGLGGAVPLELLDTGTGARMVEDAILRLAEGIFA